MNIDRMQGLLDLYIKAGKSRPAVETMAEYLMQQGLLTQEEMDGIHALMDAQDATEETIDIRASLAELKELREANASLQAERGEMAVV